LHHVLQGDLYWYKMINFKLSQVIIMATNTDYSAVFSSAPLLHCSFQLPAQSQITLLFYVLLY
jgi:hypothetical protein